jgi:hypothetical protein
VPHVRVLHVRQRTGRRTASVLFVRRRPDVHLPRHPRKPSRPSDAYLEVIDAMQKKYDLDDDGLTDCAAFIGLNLTWAPWEDGH